MYKGRLVTSVSAWVWSGLRGAKTSIEFGLGNTKFRCMWISGWFMVALRKCMWMMPSYVSRRDPLSSVPILLDADNQSHLIAAAVCVVRSRVK